jgi:serine protease AprX
MVSVKRIGMSMFLLSMAFSVQAQVNRYMVFFKDKAESHFSTTRPGEFLSEKAITRRIKQGITVTDQDIPVNSNYVQGVRETGADVFFKTKWFNGVLVQCDQVVLGSIQSLPYVDHIEFVAPLNKLIPHTGGRTKFNLQKKRSNYGPEVSNQLNQLGILDMQTAGYKGEGMTVAIFDAGFEGVNTITPFQHLFANGQVNLNVSYDFVYNTTNVFRYDDHGTQVFSVMAAQVPDAFTGGVPQANFQLYVTEDTDDEYRIEEYNWAFAAERADSAGVDVINSSLGYYDFDISSMNYTKAQMNGETAVVTKAAQWTADRGIIVVCSAGNEGNIAAWRIITAPADARDVLAVGAVDQNGTRIGISSIGPSADGRIKPDIATKGQGVKVISSAGNLSSATGTSLSSPLATSLVVGVWQRYPDLTNKEVMQIIRESASQAAHPDNLLGYGIPNFKAVVNYQERMVQDHDFEIYPNPVKDTIRISPKDPEIISSCMVELVNAQGQVLRNDSVEFTWLNRNYLIDSSAYAKGIYYVRVYHEHKRYVFKVVRE